VEKALDKSLTITVIFIIHLHAVSNKDMEVLMSLTIQKGFWGDSVLANTRQKLAELYYKQPDIAQSEKRCLLEFWATYEQLSNLLDGNWQPFVDWFLNATSPETITRCLRALKEDGTITLNSEDKKQRQESQQEWRKFWGNEKRTREEQ